MKKGNISHTVISGIFGMAGEQTQGALAITFAEQTIIHITSKILMEKIDAIDETVVDRVGEITNMFSGGAEICLKAGTRPPPA